MIRFLFLAVCLWSSVVFANKKVVDPSCGAYIFGNVTPFVLEVHSRDEGIRLNAVADAVAYYGLKFDHLDGFANILDDTLLIPASRLASTSRPAPDDADLARRGIVVHADPRPWTPGRSRSLAALNTAHIKSFKGLSPAEITFSEEVPLDRALEILANAGALYVTGEPIASVRDDWEAEVLISPAGLARLTREPAVVGRTHAFGTY